MEIRLNTKISQDTIIITIVIMSEYTDIPKKCRLVISLFHPNNWAIEMCRLYSIFY